MSKKAAAIIPLDVVLESDTCLIPKLVEWISKISHDKAVK